MDHREMMRHLLSCCEEGNAAATQNILDQDVDVNAVDNDGVTALQVAAANGHDHIVRLLLMKGAALDQANVFGFTPLLHACRHGHVSVVALLLQNTADINARTKLGANAITLAARGGHLQTCRLLMETGIDQSPATGIGGSTCEFDALMAAAHHGHDTVVRYLMDRGMDVNFRTPSLGINALMLSALNGHMTTCQVLIERGADPNHTNVNGHTPLQIATLQNTTEVKGYLDRKTTNKLKDSHEDKKPDIINAAKNGNLERIIEILEEDESQVDASFAQDGATPLMFAAMTGRLDIAQVLVQHGADINKQDCVSGWTALMQATYHGKKAVAKFLINAGANVVLPAQNGCTAFDLATLIDDVDTELYRILAAKAFQIQHPPQPSQSPVPSRSHKFHKQNGATPGAGGDSSDSHQQKTGLKAWWNRMSNRFRNLKLGRTFNMTNNRLAPSPADMPPQGSVTARNSASPKNENQFQSVKAQRKIVSAEPVVANHQLPNSQSVTEINTMQSYDTLLLETQKTASMYTLNISSQHNMVSSALFPVIPPFLPPPTFETDRPKMPPSVNHHRSMSSLHSTSSSYRPIVPPKKLLQSFSASTQNLSGSPASPSASAKFLHSNQTSPSSSAGASGISNDTGLGTGSNKGNVPSHASSASSSTLTAGSADTLNRSGGPHDMYYTPRSPLSAANPHPYQRTAAFVKSNLSSYQSSQTRSKYSSRSRKTGSSHDSASTLTPSPSPVPKVQKSHHSSSSRQSSTFQPKSKIQEEAEDLGMILKKLSLEGYQSIFEEQEVDMEAFLTLSDSDLKELGVSHTEPRRQILAAITELNSGKGRERQHLADTMSSFSSARTPRSNALFTSTDSLTSPAADQVDFETWNMRETRPTDSKNSRPS